VSDAKHYEAIVIGSGQGGTPLCMALAGAGMHTALVEREHVGGTCVNEGCTPTKTMIASGRVAYLARRGADYGVQTGSISVDMQRIRKRKREIVDSFRNGSQTRLEKTSNLDLLFGDASFTGSKSLTVRAKDGSRRELSADLVFINAGCRPAIPPVAGLSDIPFLDSTSIMELEVLPEHLLVLGGGYVGLEFGQLFRRLGSRVTIVQSKGRLLGREDADVAEAIAAILQEDGCDIFLNSIAESVAKSADQIILTVRIGDELRRIQGSHLLVATGRTPNTESLNIAAAQI
jgi:pyruvate/2-oxoglutarate dehydrogenase complex dihydrolipoamide dehydrogenase (E3) component